MFFYIITYKSSVNRDIMCTNELSSKVEEVTLYFIRDILNYDYSYVLYICGPDITILN